MRHRNARSHQKRRPVDAMEAADLLADEVHIGGPELREPGLVRRIIRPVSKRGHVVGQRVEPDVNHMLLVAGNRNAPRKTGAADGQILQPAAHKRNHLAARRLRLNKPRIRLVKLQQLALKGRELEEVVLLAHRLRDPPAIRTRRAGRHLHKGLVGDAILPRIRALVDVAAVAQRGKQLLHAALVPLLRCADEVVVRQSEPVPQAAKLCRDGRRQTPAACGLPVSPSARSSAHARPSRSETMYRCPMRVCAAQLHRKRWWSRRAPDAAAHSRSRWAW